MKVFAAFQGLAFLSPSRSFLSPQPYCRIENTRKRRATVPPGPPAPPTTTTTTSDKATQHYCFLPRSQRFSQLHSSPKNDDLFIMTNPNSDNSTMTSNVTYPDANGVSGSATATLEQPPPSAQINGDNANEEKKVLLSDILPPLPEGSRRLYLLRHGETHWNTLGKIQGGGYDIPLNENGRKQAWTTAHLLGDIPLGVIASSQLARARETADILHRLHSDTAKRVVDTGFAEMSFGEFEGLASRDEALDPKVKDWFLRLSTQLKADPTLAFPGGGESTVQVEERSRAALFKLLDDHPDAKHVAVVSHGRTNKVLLASVVLQDVKKFPQVKQSNTCINVADVDAEGNWTVQVLNFIEHVKDNVIIRPPP